MDMDTTISPSLPERTQILYIEDDADYGAAISDFLLIHGIRVKIVPDMPSLMSEILTQPPLVLMLDQYVNGHDCSLDIGRLRKAYGGPIVMLSGNTDIVDRVVCLETGADDYITKTASPREVLARLRVALRRTGGSPARIQQGLDGTSSRVRNEEVTVGDYTLVSARLMLLRDREVCCTLTRAECDMLWLLMSNVGVLIDRGSATKGILGRKFEDGQRNVDNLICRLRTKVENGGGVMLLQTIRKRGYIFDGFGVT